MRLMWNLSLIHIFPQNACEFQSKGDPITDLMEDMAAEQKARTTYDNILRVDVYKRQICISNNCRVR